MAVGALLAHAHPAQHPLILWAGALLVVVGALTAAVLAPLRYVRMQRAVRAGRTPLSTATMLSSALIVIIIAVGTTVTMVVS
jgi:uncharacterized membrane protein YidH (DUF202 family)